MVDVAVVVVILLAFWAVGVAVGRAVRAGRLDTARHEGWMAGHQEGHRTTMSEIQAGIDAESARHAGWMEGFDAAANVKMSVREQTEGDV